MLVKLLGFLSSHKSVNHYFHAVWAFRSCYCQACSQKIWWTYPYSSHRLKEVTQNTVSGLYLQDKYLLHWFGSQLNTVLFHQRVRKEGSYLQLFYVVFFFPIKINKYKTIISLLLVLLLAFQNICKEKKEQYFFFSLEIQSCELW